MKAIIIGAGIAGCSTAYALAKRGIQVTLIEKHHEIASEASGNPLAMLYPKLSAKPSMQSLLQSQAFDFTFNLLNQLPNNAAFFKACGQLQLAFNAAEQAKHNALFDIEYLHKNSGFCEFLNAAETTEAAGIEISLNSLLLKQAGWVQPKLFCAALIAHHNIKLQTNRHATRIKACANGWRVECDDAIEADMVVICNANDVKQFGFCDSAEITAVRGQLNFFEENPTSSALKTIVCSDHFISPAVDGWHSVGASYAPNDANPQVCAKDTASNLAVLRKISPKLFESVTQTTGRVGWRSQTLDYLPLAGELLDEKMLQQNPPRYNANPADLPWLKGLYVNAGHGSKGMMTAPFCGELIARLASHEALNCEAKLASKLNPNRFLLKNLGLKQLANSLHCAPPSS